MIQEGDELLTVQEASVKIGVSDSAIRNALGSHRLAFERRYGRKLIRLADLLEYQTRTQAEGTPRVGRPRKQKTDSDL